MTVPEKGERVLVTTDSDRRGVFAGILKSYDREKRFIVLSEARMVVKWSAETHGVLGLCDEGPKTGCRISPCSDRVDLDGVTMVALISDEAWERFELEPWD